MKKHNYLLVITLGLFFVNCSETKDAFTIESKNLKQIYKPSESIDLEISNTENIAIDSVVYYANETKIAAVKQNQKTTFKLHKLSFGTQEIKALVFTEGKPNECVTSFELVSEITPKILSYTIVNTYEHDLTSYTQGLEFYNGILYESTGQRGASKVRKINYKTGNVTQNSTLEPQYFGEGLTIFNNKVYQLTWQEKTGFIYNTETLQREKTFTYFKDMEGWGLTHNDKYLIMSDGTNTIYFLDPATQKLVRSINVYTDTSKIDQINELEWIDGKIWANIYQKDALAIINPENGAVEAVIDLSELKTKVKQHENIDVLNGIAYNPATKTVFVTGKNWDKLFELIVNQ